MAINIKPVRGEIEQKSIGNRGSTLLDSVKSNRINYEGFTNELSAIAQTINSHNDKLNQRRITNKSTKYNALMSTDAQNFSQEIELGKYNTETQTYDPYTLDEITTKQKEFEKKMEKKYKNTIYKNDEEGWEHFASYYWNNLKAADKGSHQGNKKKILADTAISWSVYKTSQADEIKSIKADESMWLKKEQIIAKEKEMFASAVTAGVSNIDLTANIKAINNEFLIKAITAGHEKQLFGDGINGNKTGYNWSKIVKEINSDKEYFGYKLNDDEKESLLDYAKNKAAEQDFWEIRSKNQHNEKLFKDNIESIRNGTMTISQIEDLKFTEDEEGNKLKNELVTYARNKMLGNLPDESEILMFRHLRSEVVEMNVTSLTEKTILPSDNKIVEKFTDAQKVKYLNKKGEFVGMSIMERVNEGFLSDDDYQRLYSIVNDPQLTTNLREFSKMIKAHEKEIRGVLDKYDLKADVRVYQLETLAEREFIKGLKEGKKPEDMLDPFHEHFILKPALLERFTVSISEQSKLISEQMAKNSAVIGEVKWEGPVWANYKDKYATVDEFYNGIEFQTYLKTESFKKWEKATKGADVKVASGQKKSKKITNEKESGVFKFKEYDDGSVEPKPKAKTLKYYEWLKVYNNTHNPDGTPKNKGFLMEE